MILVSITGVAQLDNSAFEDRIEIDSSKQREIYFSLNTLGFIKNNEYSNDIADGFTLFGYQFNPYLSYFAGKNVRIDAGIYLQQDFGIDDFTEIAPYFSLKVQKRNFALIFGNFESSLNHRYIEPIYDFERVLNDRLENGIQGLWMTEKLFLDLWLNWETMIFEGDPFQEKFSAGVSFDYIFELNQRLRFNIPIQILGYHKGGQIDSSPDPVTTLINGAIGGGLTYDLGDGFLRSIGTQDYFVFYSDLSDQKIQTYEDGFGVYLNATAKTKLNLDIMISYWRGEEFITIKGGQLYPSISSSFKSGGTIEPIRELLFFRFLHNWQVLNEFTISSRIEPYIDIRNNLFEFSFGVYLHFRPDFYLAENRAGR